MMMRYFYLREYPSVFVKMTGLQVPEFDELAEDVQARLKESEAARLDRPERQRGLGGGRKAQLDRRDQLLLTVIWLRLYLVQELLAYFFGISQSAVSNYLARVLPVLEQAGRDTMRMPDPGRKRRRALDQLVADLPDVLVVIDSFEQKVQRPRDPDEQQTFYSGKKKTHTLKSQVAVDEQTGEVVAVSDRVPGPTADITLLDQSGLNDKLPDEVGRLGDSGYQGIAQRHEHGYSPRKTPRGKPRPAEDVAYHHAFSRLRIIVENTLGRMRRYQAITQPDRQHRQHHTACVVAVAGLANRQIRCRQLAAAL